MIYLSKVYKKNRLSVKEEWKITTISSFSLGLREILTLINLLQAAGYPKHEKLMSLPDLIG
jgi:hypothetical protein